MEKIIDPISKNLIKSELTIQKRVRSTNKANNEIYVFTAHDSPNLMREVGRLREIAFRHYGGGTGLKADIDKYDTMDIPYRQLIVWDPENEEILGGYRFIYGSDVESDENGKPILATAHLLNFSQEFINEYLPYTVELGRSLYPWNISQHYWEEREFLHSITCGTDWGHSLSLTPISNISSAR